MTAANNPQNNVNNHNNKEIPIKEELNDVEKADVAKLHNEVNQLRNHELLINSFAIAMVAVALPVIKDSIIFSIGMLFFLIAIHYWQYTLLDIRTRITTYLDVCGFSAWERYYRELSDEHHKPSMRMASIILFIVLSCITIIPATQKIYEWYVGVVVVVVVAVFIYFGFGYFFVFINWRKDKTMRDSLKNCNYFDFKKDPNKKSIDAIIIKRYKDIWKEKLKLDGGIRTTNTENS